MRSVLGATALALVLVACGKAASTSDSQLDAANGKAPANESLNYTVTYLGASQQGQATLNGGKVTLRIKNLPRGQSGQMLVELASGSTKKYVGRVNGLSVSDKVSTKRLALSKAAGSAAPVQTAAQQDEGVKKRRAQYCGNGGGGDFGGDFDDGRFGGNDDFRDGDLRGDDFRNDDFRDDRFRSPNQPQAQAQAQAQAAQEGELILELAAPKG